jgi:hypothetical protein
MRNTYNPIVHTENRDAQRPNFCVLRRAIKFADWHSDFRGEIELEDGRHYLVGISVGIAPNGEDFLRMYLRAPARLQKTPVTSSGTLGVVR